MGTHPAQELDHHLKAAGIPKHTPEGKIAFHAPRTSFVTLTYEAGATHKEAQELARHKTPELPANTYARTRNERLVRIAEKMGESVLFGANMVRASDINVTPDARKYLSA